MPNLQNKKGRSKTKEWYLGIPHYLLSSIAWRSLTPIAKVTFLEGAAFYRGTNNGRIALPTRLLAERMGVGKSTVSAALRELVDTGFIVPTRIGSFSSQNRKASEYRFTHLPCDLTGERRTNDFMKPGQELGGRRRDRRKSVENRSS